jgi:osmotically-inducible protein OsmY
MANQNGWSDDRRDYNDDGDAWRRLRDRDYGVGDEQRTDRNAGYGRARSGGSAGAYGQGYGQGQGVSGWGVSGRGLDAEEAAFGRAAGGYFGQDGGAAYGRYDRGFGAYESGRDERSGEPRNWWDRTTDKVSSFFGDDDAARRNQRDERYAGQHAGRGPKDYKRSDERIREDINDRLTDDAHLDATEISVAVKDGEVTLSGKVQQRQDKRRAEDLAERSSGVKHVQNNLRVHDRNYDAQTAQAGSPSNPGSTATSGATGSRSSLS